MGYSLSGSEETGLYQAAAAAEGYSLSGGGESGTYPAAAAAEGYSPVGEGGAAVGKALEGGRGPKAAHPGEYDGGGGAAGDSGEAQLLSGG